MKSTVYFYELFINSIVSAGIIFPTYFICKKFSSEKISIAISLLGAISPATVLYSPLLLSENIFIPLFMVTLWLLLEFFDNGNQVIGFFLGLGIFYLILTRVQGIIVIIAFVIITILYILKNNSQNMISLFRFFFPPYFSLIFFSALWTIYKLSLPQIFTSSSQYSINYYLSNFFIIFGNSDSFFLFFRLLTNEIVYLLGSVVILPLRRFDFFTDITIHNIL